MGVRGPLLVKLIKGKKNMFEGGYKTKPLGHKKKKQNKVNKSNKRKEKAKETKLR